jgi:hypothetical protein
MTISANVMKEKAAKFWRSTESKLPFLSLTSDFLFKLKIRLSLTLEWEKGSEARVFENVRSMTQHFSSRNTEKTKLQKD